MHVINVPYGATWVLTPYSSDLLELCYMGQHGCSLTGCQPSSLVTPGCRWERMMWQDPSTGYHIVDPMVRASHSTVCHHYSMALLRWCMMRQDPSEQWLPEVMHWVQPSS